jgi:hypothetical protein
VYSIFPVQNKPPQLQSHTKCPWATALLNSWYLSSSHSQTLWHWWCHKSANMYMGAIKFSQLTLMMETELVSKMLVFHWTLNKADSLRKCYSIYSPWKF